MEFKTWAELVNAEREERWALQYNSLCNFGISVLNDAMRRILPNDFIVIGADSGIGKSTIGLHIARHNAMQGKTVAVFFLEGGHNEAIRRLKWKTMCNEYYGHKDEYPHIEMDATDWRMRTGDLKTFDMLELKAQEKMKKLDQNLSIYDMTPGTGGETSMQYSWLIQSLSTFLGGFKENANTKKRELTYDLDLLIIDHLHYFDMEDGTRSTEAQKLTKILNMCREIVNIHGIPVILISHLRKKSKDRGLPDQEDFFGTSNICKMSSESFILTPCFNEELSGHRENFIFPTFFRFVKSGTGRLLKPNYAVLVDFNSRVNKYDDNYRLFGVDTMGHIRIKEQKGRIIDTGELTHNQYPAWAQKAINKKEAAYVPEEQKNWQDVETDGWEE